MAIIIEFVGSPGAGKTTSCRYFSALLKEKGFKVAILQDLKDYIHGMTLFERFFLISKFLLLRGPKLLYYTVILALNRIYSITSIYRYMRLLIFNLALHQYIKSRNIDVVLLEQWAIQELWSATIFRLKSYKDYDKLINHLKIFYFKIDFVFYFDIDMETASERIKMRNTSRSRFDKMDSDKRLEELIKYNTYLFQLYKNSGCRHKFFYSTEISPERNAEHFIQHMNHTLNNRSY